MSDKDAIRDRLRGVMVPGVKRSLHDLNLIREIHSSDRKVTISLASAALHSGAREWLENKIKEVLAGEVPAEHITVTFIEAKAGEVNQIDRVVAVMSGKGGVGKSLVASLLGIGLAREGKNVGILDADITGPSIPRMFGVVERPAGNETGIMPVLSRAGIELMSINLLLPHEEDAVIWRGPLIARTITQFWEDVVWGRLDYLIVDLPPGTADASLTVMQSLPIKGVVIVFTPQDLVEMIVRKAVNMATQMGKPVLGVVENMSYLALPDSNRRLEIFGRSRAQEMAKKIGAPLLAQLPIDPELARLCDEGNIERYNGDVVSILVDNFNQALSAGAK